MTPDEWAIEAAKRRDAQRPKQPRKRAGKTPEAKVSAEIDRYLKQIGAITIRTNAGAWQDETGHWIMGAKAGTSDKVLCLRGGHFAGLEVKSSSGRQTEAQQRFQARVEALGGLYILARGKADVRAALVQRFGEGVVASWEASDGRTRQR